MSAPATPRLTGTQRVEVTQRLLTLVRCPKCEGELDITDLKAGAVIECAKCQNCTWVPEYVPKWWHRVRNFIWSLLIAFAIGVASSVVANLVWSRMHQPSPTTSQVQNGRKTDVH